MKGRPRKPVTIEQQPQIEEHVRQELAVTDQDAQRIARIDERFGDGLPFNVTRIVAKGRGIVESWGYGALELGRMCLWLKERLPHGDYIEAVESMGISRRFAYKCSQAALRFLGPNDAAPRHLAALGSSKLLELLVLDDDDIEALREGETVDGKHLDQFDRMSMREIRAWARKRVEEKKRDDEVHERVLKQKNEKIDEYEKRLARRDSASSQERERSLWEELWDRVKDCGAPLERLDNTLRAIAELEAAENISPALDEARNQALSLIGQVLVDIGARRGAVVDLKNRVTPPWEKDGAA